MQNTILRFCRIPTGSILTQLQVSTSIRSTLYQNSLEFIAIGIANYIFTILIFLGIPI